PVNEYKVRLELAPQFQADPSALSLLYFKASPTTGAGQAGLAGGPGGAGQAGVAGGAGQAGGAGGAGGAGTVVPLDTLAHTTQVVGPQTVNHHGQLPAVTISFGLAPGASLRSAPPRLARVPGPTAPQAVSRDV